MVTEIKKCLAGVEYWLKKGYENVVYLDWAGSYTVYKVSKPTITLYNWNLCILLYVNCISIALFKNKLKATQVVRSITDTGTLVVCLSASFQFFFFLSGCTLQNQVKLVIGTEWLSEAAWQKTWEVSMESTIKSETLNHQLRTTLEIAMTHANFKHDKIMK